LNNITANDKTNTVINKYSNVPPANSVSVLTQHNDNSRAGWNSHETILNTNNVNSSLFGKQFTMH